MLVKEIMTKEVITVHPEASIRELAELLVSNRISGVPVVDAAGERRGIVSEGDLLRKEAAPDAPAELCILGAIIYYNGLTEYRDAFRKFAALTAEQIMTEKVMTVKGEDEVGKVAKLMLNKHIKRLPVVDDNGQLVGIVSRADIVKMFL